MCAVVGFAATDATLYDPPSGREDVPVVSYATL